MTDGAWEVVGQDYQQFPLGKTIGDGLRDLIRKRWKNNAAKCIEAKWGLDPKTAKNVVTSGHVSERTLTKAIRAERWALWMALGEEVLEEAYEEFLRGVIHEHKTAAARTSARQDQLRRLEARASALVDLWPGGVDRSEGPRTF